MKKLLLLLLMSSFSHPMQRNPGSLISLCIKKIEYNIQWKLVDSQSALLARKIDTNFMKRYRTANNYGYMAILIEACKLSQENDLLRITPVSAEFKNVPEDIAAKFSPHFLKDVAEDILPQLYSKFSLVRNCTDSLIVGTSDSWWREHVDNASASPVLIKFLNKRKGYHEQARMNYDNWCP